MTRKFLVCNLGDFLWTYPHIENYNKLSATSSEMTHKLYRGLVPENPAYYSTLNFFATQITFLDLVTDGQDIE
jgi:hypothetical protein